MSNARGRPRTRSQPATVPDEVLEQTHKTPREFTSEEYRRGMAEMQVAAENWMLAIEKHHHSIGCLDDFRVRLSTFLLRGDAERWWETARQRFGDRGLTWAEFQQMFNVAYCPAWVQEQKTYEFIDLVQGSKTVAQYEAEFTALARYAPELVSTEAKKASKFQRGPRADIRHAFGGVQCKEYAVAVQRAYVVERDRNEWRAIQASKKGAGSSFNGKKGKWAAGQGHSQGKEPLCC
ncbi:uncharacterized protein LOC127812723 [Diospyros lotus]|uniref:uncharacterized protein LOC127812723 n=1 Tax=Diospyros lotus TaxID=55363 RepID=UPI002259A23F|nr:uncharacterized protein LOC127812723 [Diospyros lotus]